MSLSALISPLSVAPMIDWTYSHFRVLMRLLAPKALLYTEMQTIGAIVNNPTRSLHYHPSEQPLALQLGGADEDGLVYCARIAQNQGFSEVNLNLGCPSDRVQAGQFGACLMAKPDQVARCISAMKRAVSIPVTAKTRIGIDTQDSYEFFVDFVQQLVDAGCDKVIVHARKAWLHGLNPKQNRTIPPLHYQYVYDLKESMPSIPVVINGNIITMDEIRQHLTQVDGVMLGRLVCQNPYALAGIHQALYPDIKLLSRSSIIDLYLDHIKSVHPIQGQMSLLIKPILNMAHGMPGARLWKAHLMEVIKTGHFSGLGKFMRELESNLEPIDTVSDVD